MYVFAVGVRVVVRYVSDDVCILYVHYFSVHLSRAYFEYSCKFCLCVRAHQFLYEQNDDKHSSQRVNNRPNRFLI